jgi:hypothetical protein
MQHIASCLKAIACKMKVYSLNMALCSLQNTFLVFYRIPCGTCLYICVRFYHSPCATRDSLEKFCTPRLLPPFATLKHQPQPPSDQIAVQIRNEHACHRPEAKFTRHASTQQVPHTSRASKSVRRLCLRAMTGCFRVKVISSATDLTNDVCKMRYKD